MAKLSSVNKNERRKKLVKKYAGKYARLKAQADDKSLDDTERLMARLKLAEIPRNGNPTRVRNRCATTGRPRGLSRASFAPTSVSNPAVPDISPLNVLVPGNLSPNVKSTHRRYLWNGRVRNRCGSKACSR